MRGVVLDAGGGQKRGVFKKPDNATWIVLDITSKYKPDVLADVHRLPIKSGVIDCVKFTEVLQYLEYPEKAIEEIGRVLKKGGVLILSIPFNIGAMLDFPELQRFTDHKLKMLLEKTGFEIVTLKKQGLFFTTLGYMLKQAILNSTTRLKYPFFLFLPAIDMLVKLDTMKFVKRSKFLSSFTTGFFIVAIKKGERLGRNTDDKY
jgi:SAM-dependent methyltransferase